MNNRVRWSSDGANRVARGVPGLSGAGGVLIVLLLISVPGWGSDGVVSIVSPKSGQTVTNDVTVTWTQEKAGSADHVHVFVDGAGMKPVKTGTSTIVRGLANGMHEITVQAYSREHEPLEAKASVTVKVE
ncbi:MAG: Ig-like domain-containing protein [Nitrospiria bacterium]